MTGVERSTCGLRVSPLLAASRSSNDGAKSSPTTRISGSAACSGATTPANPCSTISALTDAKAALRSIRSARSNSLVLLARLVQRLAPEPVDADLRGPWQHQRAAAAVAIDALERQ